MSASTTNAETVTVSDEYFKMDLKVKMRLLLFIKFKLEKNISHQGETTLNEKDIMENFFSLRFGDDQHLNYLSKYSIDDLMVFNMIKSICDDNPDSECDEYLKLSNTLHAGDQQHSNVVEYIYEKLKGLQKLQLDDDNNKKLTHELVGILKSKKSGDEKKSDINHKLTEVLLGQADVSTDPAKKEALHAVIGQSLQESLRILKETGEKQQEDLKIAKAKMDELHANNNEKMRILTLKQREEKNNTDIKNNLII